MPRYSTFPTCLDEVKKITIASLRETGFLKPHRWISGTLRWSRGGQPSGSVSVTVDNDAQVMELRYASNDRPVEYRVHLESLPSNLGSGRVLYFVCPATGKRCRTLYQCGDYFYSRFAFANPLYSSQTESKSTRELLRAMRILSIGDDFLNKRFSRTHYKGKITKRYQRILNRERRYNPDRVRLALNRIGV